MLILGPHIEVPTLLALETALSPKSGISHSNISFSAGVQEAYALSQTA